MQRYQVGDDLKLGLTVIDVIPGGMGIIYIAEMRAGTGSLKLAVKSCDLEKGLGPDFREKFRRESMVWISLPPHKHIVEARAFEFDGGLPMLTMEYLEGGNLRDRINRGRLAFGEVARIALEVCDGMVFLADGHNIIHLDIKPENVLFNGEGRAKITDFGLARAFARDSEKSRLGRLFGAAGKPASGPHIIAGTLPYMSLEQLRGGENLDQRADIYSFGVMLFEMLAGHRPFEANDARGYVSLIRKGAIPPLPDSIPSEVQRVVACCLASDAANRFSSFAELREALVEATSQIGATDLASGKVADSDEAEDALDWSNRGYGYAQMGDLEEALRCYRHGLAVLAATKRGDDVLITQGVDKQINSTDGAFVILQTNMGAVLARLQRFDEAREAYEAALAVVPDDGVSYFRLGEIALREGRVADGLSLIKKGTQCEPGNWDLLLKYIRACLRFGSKAESEAHLRAFLSAKKTDSPFIVGVGCALDDEFGPEVAVRCFDAALEHDEDYAAAWYNRGVALHRAGKFLEATKCYENTVRLDRNHVFARCYLGATLLAQGRRDEAEQQFKRFLQSAAPSPLTNLVAMAIQGSAFGLPLESLLSPLNEAQAIKHVM